MNTSKARLKVLQPDTGEDDTCVTFILKDEDHTLGNSLRYVIMKNPKVKYCAYAIPHPSSREIYLRIQTNGIPAADAFKKGLEDLHSICDHVTETFKEALETYEEKSLREGAHGQAEAIMHVED